MSVITRWLNSGLDFLRRSLDENLHWQIQRQEHLSELKQTRALAEQALAAQLRKHAQQLAHELAVTKTKHNNELAMVKIQCKQELKDYQQYLLSLDKLKESLRNTYTDLPEAMAYTIHHHAKQLLNNMWDAEDNREKMKFEMQLLQFMAAVHEDNQSCLLGAGSTNLPLKALAIIDADSEN
ncbi:MAG: hypothetical protein ABSB19_04475 [Methylomonas sp.]|jgi:hypothetical protein